MKGVEMIKATLKNKEQNIERVKKEWRNAAHVWTESGNWNFEIDSLNQMIRTLETYHNFYFELY